MCVLIVCLDLHFRGMFSRTFNIICILHEDQRQATKFGKLSLCQPSRIFASAQNKVACCACQANPINEKSAADTRAGFSREKNSPPRRCHHVTRMCVPINGGYGTASLQAQLNYGGIDRQRNGLNDAFVINRVCPRILGLELSSSLCLSR